MKPVQFRNVILDFLDDARNGYLLLYMLISEFLSLSQLLSSTFIGSPQSKQTFLQTFVCLLLLGFLFRLYIWFWELKVLLSEHNHWWYLILLVLISNYRISEISWPCTTFLQRLQRVIIAIEINHDIVVFSCRVNFFIRFLMTFNRCLSWRIFRSGLRQALRFF